MVVIPLLAYLSELLNFLFLRKEKRKEKSIIVQNITRKRQNRITLGKKAKREGHNSKDDKEWSL